MADRQRSRERRLETTSRSRSKRRTEARLKPSAQEPAGGAAGRRRRFWIWVALVAMMALFARYYYWTIHPNPSRPIREIGLYSVLTDAFLHGQASLRVKPAPQLLALPDPFDPVLNRPYRVHDASLYRGQYYLYYGPSPVIALYLPYAFLTGELLPDRVGTWVFATAALGMGCLLLKLVIESWWPRSPPWLYFFLTACLGFSNTFPFLLRRPAVYETAIAAGQFFLLLALYAIIRSALSSRRALWLPALGGMALAAAFGARPQLVLAAVSLGGFLVLGKGIELRERLRRLAAALAPFTAGSILLLIYNYVRFGSIFEFGTHYMLSGFNVRKAQLFSFSRMIQNLWFSILEPPRLRSKFPFVVLAPNPPFHLPKNLLGLEVVAGIVWTAPLVLLLVLAAVAWKRMEPGRRMEWGLCTGTLLLLGGAWIGVDGLLGSTMRYQADYSTVLLVAAALVIAGLFEGGSPLARTWLTRGVVVLGLWGVVVNGAVGMTGYYDNFRLEAPSQYQRVADWFSPVEKALVWCGVPPDRAPNPAVSR